MGSIACTEPYCVFAFIDFGAMQILTKMNTVQRIQNNSAVVVFKRYIANPFARHTNKYTLLRSSDFYRATADENKQKKLVSTRLFTTFTLFDILYVWCRDCNRIHKKKWETVIIDRWNGFDCMLSYYFIDTNAYFSPASMLVRFSSDCVCTLFIAISRHFSVEVETRVENFNRHFLYLMICFISIEPHARPCAKYVCVFATTR